MKTLPSLTSIVRFAATFVVGLSVTSALAHPYATCLTNNDGTVSFRLNESNSVVTVVGNGGTLTNILGSLSFPQFGTNGLVITNLSSVGGSSIMTGGVFSVIVTKVGTGVPALISDNANQAVKFFGPRGVAVNTRPASPYFGRIYVGNAPGTTAGAPTRATGDGIYILNSDCTEAVGQGNTALNGGLDFATGGASNPWRLRVGKDDDLLYISNFADEGTTNSAGLNVTDANVSPGSGNNVFQLLNGPLVGTGAGLPAGYTHGSVSEVYVTGSLGGGDLTVYTTDEDYETTPGALAELNSLWRYDIGSGPLPWSNAPNAKVVTPSVAFVGQTMGLDRGANGYLYVLDNRSAGTQNLLQVVDPTGPTILYDSITASAGLGFGYDILSNAVSCAVSPDQKFLAVQRTGGTVVIVPLVNGIPNLAGRFEFNGIGSSARQIAFDAADNVYLISNITERMRVYTLGLSSTAITSSDGTFSFVTPATEVSATVLDPLTTVTNVIAEANLAVFATISVERTNDDFSGPLTVNFTVGGTATRGTQATGDYSLRTNGVVLTNITSVIIPTGSSNILVDVVANNDAVAELTETIVFALSGGAYTAVAPQGGTIAIVDDEPATVDVSLVQASAFEANTNDYVRLNAVRRGDTNAASFTVNLSYAGTAVSNVDYIAVETMLMDPGEVTKSFDIFPIDDTILETNETFTVTAAAGAGYVVGTGSGVATIVEDEVPAATVLFSDDFNGDSSTNWVVRFAAGNGIDDYRINEQILTFPATPYDYSLDNIPPAPNGTDQLGIKLTVNKDEGTALGGAGINIYPTNAPVFSGNYAFRFDMYLIINTGAGTTEYAMAGINHSGNNTNWFRSSGNGIGAGNPVDGLFVQIEADGAALGDYVLNTTPVSAGPLFNPTAVASRNASTLAGSFKVPPWGISGLPGAPGNQQGTTTPSWAQVEINQIGNVVTLKINNTNIFSYVNNGSFQSGNIMLGYCDAFDSNTGVGAAVIYDNVRVVDLSRPKITSVSHTGVNSVLDFNWTLDDSTSAYRIQRATVVTGPYADVSPAATITKLGPATYRATLTTETNSAAYYRVRR